MKIPYENKESLLSTCTVNIKAEFVLIIVLENVFLQPLILKLLFVLYKIFSCYRL